MTLPDCAICWRSIAPGQGSRIDDAGDLVHRDCEPERETPAGLPVDPTPPSAARPLSRPDETQPPEENA